MIQKNLTRVAFSLLLVLAFTLISSARADNDDKTLRVFIFAGQSNMVGSDSKVEDIKRFPPFAGLEQPQTQVMFSYCIGRENKMTSDGWVNLQPVDNVVGPELSFARDVSQSIKAPIAIIKCAAGGTHLGGDWNPDTPGGFKMYPLALELIRSSLQELDEKNIPYKIEGFMWHQGENDMFNEEYKANYGKNLKNFLASWRRDLKTPQLKFYIGELCTKTIWGMDLRPRMYAISLGQKAVTQSDLLADYVPTSHVGVEIGGGVGLHYHYGTLGQLEHGVNYASAYLKTIGQEKKTTRSLRTWPYKKGSRVKLFVLAGHRNMEGERAFVQELKTLKGKTSLLSDNMKIAYKYSLGGGYKTSDGWEPLGPAGYYDTFGPELSFGQTLQQSLKGNMAIAKFTHSGSQINDWTPEGSMAKTRHIYPGFIQFIKDSMQELKDRGHAVELAGIFYHVGENDMSMGPYRDKAATWLQSAIVQSRQDLGMPALTWFVSQQSPTDHPDVNRIDVTSALEAIAAADTQLIHIKAFDLPEQEKQLVIDTPGIIKLGELIARRYLTQENKQVKTHKVPETREKYLTTQYKKQNRDQITKIAGGQAAQAAAYYEAYLQSIPDDLESMFGMVAACTQTGHFDKAMFWLKTSVKGGLPFERYLAGPRDLFEPLYRQPMFREYAQSKKVQLLHGPVLGSVTDTRARFWVRTTDEMRVTVRVSESENERLPLRSGLAYTKKADDFTAVVEVNGLKPNTQYRYNLLLNGQPATLPNTTSFHTFPRAGSKSQFTLAFGGGAGYTPWFEHMWTTLAQDNPLAMIALGDNVYIDTPDVHQTQRYCYYRRQSRPEYRAFAATTPIFAVWDDHDFANNDCCNGPVFNDPPWKKDVLKVFTENFVNPYYGGGDKTPGIWFDFQIGDVDFFLPDTRMYRDFLDTKPRSMLGPVQKQWLKDKLRTSTATFKVIASSLPWAMGAKPGSKDPWSAFPDEREELFAFIEQSKIDGVVLISADRHRSDAWKISRSTGYDFYEFMSSKMTNVVKHGLMKKALFGYNEKCSYGRLTFDTEASDPTVTYTIVNIEGEEIHSLTVKKSELMHP